MLKKNFWRDRQQSYLTIFAESLPELQLSSQGRFQPYDNEDDISRDLSFAIERVIFSPKYNSLRLGLPTFQVYSQPDSTDKAKVKREDKCPDFLWTYVDYANRKRRDFYVECKRLRDDLTSHCREYVSNGLNRFLNKEWSYGYNCDSGLMVGYVEGVTINDCLIKIEAYLLKSSIPSLVKFYESPDGNITLLKHRLDRLEVPQTPFDLHHFLLVIK